MGQPAAKQGDRIIATDTHIVIVPGTPPTMVALPHPFSGIIRISRAIQEALLEFEPRIDVLDVRVNNQSDEAGEKLLIDINYQVRATNNAFNLVYPFYLERSAG